MKVINQWCVELSIKLMLGGIISLNQVFATSEQNRCLQTIGQLQGNVSPILLEQNAINLSQHIKNILEIDNTAVTPTNNIHWPQAFYRAEVLSSSAENAQNLATTIASIDSLNGRNAKTANINLINTAQIIDDILSSNGQSFRLTSLLNLLNNPAILARQNRDSRQKIATHFDELISNIFNAELITSDGQYRSDICINTNLDKSPLAEACSSSMSISRIPLNINQLITTIPTPTNWENPGPFTPMRGTLQLPLGVEARIPAYPVNNQAEYCMRNPDLVDTILIHHTASTLASSAEQINRAHRARPGEPWLMVGYNFLIQGDYVSSIGAPSTRTTGQPIPITQGRPLDMRGAHAGGPARVVTSEMRELFQRETMYCYNPNSRTPTEVNVDELYLQGEPPTRDNPNPGPSISANITGIGIAVIGNYSPMYCQNSRGNYYVCNRGGYTRAPRYASAATLQRIAQLACSLQKMYPRMLSMKPHSEFRVDGTACPGTIHESLDAIINYAREYGCTFTK